jgi:beta-lactam-binding protein with PASTA domain/predicted Ser/Thr protein kinase
VSDVFQPEQVVGGRYRVVRKLGGGGMADVYLCEDLTLGRHVAIKVLLQRYLNDPTFVERFRREAKAAAGLNHQNLVSIYDWGEVEGTYYIVMEYVEGETLKDLIRRRGRLSGNESVGIALQLLAAVEFAHRSGIVHRDIKPQNVMIDRGGTVKVMDFGIARAGDSGMTEAGSILGTAQYLAPEQAKGYPVDERSDLYSVGVVLYEMLTGSVPFRGDSAVTVALKHVNEVPREPAELVPGLPYALNQIVLKAMAKDPADRYQSAAEFGRDLRSAREGGPVQAAAFDAGGERTRVMAGAEAAGLTSVLDQPSRRRKKSRWPLVLVVLLLAIIAAVAIALWWTMSGDKKTVPSVVGLSRSAAVAAVEKAGFKAGIQEEFSERVAAGFVSRQAPTGGTRLREGGTVDIWVSKGSEKVTLQDFKGWTDTEVDDWLSKNDLVGDRRTGKSGAVADGQVFKQDPPAGTEVQRGDTISYWVSTGKPQATVPALANMSQADATNALTAAGLKLGNVSSELSESVPAGYVIRQDPPAGQKVDKGSTVDIVLSIGPPTPSPTPTPSSSPSSAAVSVPNVYGMQSVAAEQELTALGLEVAYRQKANTGQPSGTVVNVRPDTGTMVPEGSTVLLVIAA